MLFFAQLLMILVIWHKIVLRVYFKNMNCKYGFLQYIRERIYCVLVIHVTVPLERKYFSTDILMLMMIILQQIVLQFWYENFQKSVLFVIYPGTVTAL
jgi:hypothetical protein